MPDHFMQRRHHVFGLVVILLAERELFGRRGELLQRSIARGVRQRPTAYEEELLLPYFSWI